MEDKSSLKIIEPTFEGCLEFRSEEKGSDVALGTRWLENTEYAPSGRSRSLNLIRDSFDLLALFTIGIIIILSIMEKQRPSPFTVGYGR